MTACTAPAESSGFLSTLPARGATKARPRVEIEIIISIHAPREGSDVSAWLTTSTWTNFYPRSPRGERPSPAASTPPRPPSFLSTLPARGATADGQPVGHHVLFLSTLPARGATFACPHPHPLGDISIHAPREGSDGAVTEDGTRYGIISIHAPREGSDPRRLAALPGREFDFYPRSPRGERPALHLLPGGQGAFLSTLPARGATGADGGRPDRRRDFYPRSPRGERPLGGRAAVHPQHFYPRSPRGERLGKIHCSPSARQISIHAPREGSDVGRRRRRRHVGHFYPRSPRGERHLQPVCPDGALPISIHAPREGSDTLSYRTIKEEIISIHAPREGSDSSPVSASSVPRVFLSTLPARGATCWSPAPTETRWAFLSTLPARGATSGAPCCRARPCNFYPRSPRGERRHRQWQQCARRGHFYPRSPRGERPLPIVQTLFGNKFLSTLPARGATAIVRSMFSFPSYFYPRSPRGERPRKSRRPTARTNFYPRSPRGERPRPSGRAFVITRISIHAPREGSDPTAG